MPDHSPDEYESDDEDGFPWDFDLGLPLWNEDDED